jgi:hypothetical protein
MPLVAIRTGFIDTDGNEEILKEYVCDWPGCPNLAVHSLGCIPELRVMAIVCDEHRPKSQGRTAA